MNLINHDINLDFSTSDIKRTVIKQDSNQTHGLTIKLYDNNGRIKLDTNWQYTISCRKADDTFIVNSNNISVSSNTIYVEVTKQMTSCSGTEKCELLIQDGNQTLYSGTFYLYIEVNVNYGSALESTNEYDSLSDTLKQIQEYEKESEKTKEHIQEISTDIDATYEELAEAVNTTNDLIEKNRIIETNEAVRKTNETSREENEQKRQENTANAVQNANDAADNANAKAKALQNKLNSHHFVLTEDKDTTGGVAGLDANSKVSNGRLYEASTNAKGITQLDDSVTSSSSSKAATSKAVKTAYDKAVSANADLQTHNSSFTAHDDIRTLVSDLTTRLNALADSDDTTLDQLSEIVAYIKNNKSLIDNVTTSKVNVSDIIDSLTSTAVNKPLAAKQGKILKGLIDALTTAVENKADKSSLDAKVSKDGDEMSGELVLKSGSMVAREYGISGVYGYVKMIQIKILREYVNYPIIFEITGRNWEYSRKLYVRFKNINGTDPELNCFLIDNPAEYKVAIIKSDTSTWDIYMQKSERYSTCFVCGMSNTNYADTTQITFPDTLVSTLPEGVIEPTVITWDKAKNADTVDGKHFSDIQGLINAKQNIRNGVVGEGVDWNTVTTAGAYKVQYATMSDDKHSPVGEYRFGILYVIDSEVGGETRILQMYFPHQPNISPIHIRMRNNGVWKDWVSVTSSIGTTGNAATLEGMDKNQFVHKANPVFDGNLNCRKNIWFNGEDDSKMMIEFLESGDAYGHGISIGGGGMTIIGGGESAYEIVNYYTNNRTVNAGGNENMIVANDQAIDFYTNCQNGFSSAKHITMNTDGTITANGLNLNGDATGNITSSLVSGTHLAANKGKAIINSTAAGTGYNMLARMKSNNGVWTLGHYDGAFRLYYTDDDMIASETNGITRGIKIFGEDGSSSFAFANHSHSNYLTGITKNMVTSALGYTPPSTNTTYSVATQSANGLMSASDKKKLDGLSASGGIGRTLVTLPAGTEASKVFTLSGQDICKGLKLYFYYHSNSSQGSSSSTLVKTVILTQSALTDNAISVNGKDVTIGSNSYTNIVKGYVDTTTLYTLTCKCADINNAPLFELGNISFTFGFGSPTASWFSIEAVDL